MELLHSTHQFPAIVIPSHRAFTTQKKKKKKEDIFVLNLDVVSFRRRRVAIDASSSSQEAETETQHFQSSFDEYLKAMESVNKTRQERNKDGLRAKSSELKSIRTAKLQRKEKEKEKEKQKNNSYTPTVSSEVGIKKNFNYSSVCVNLRLEEKDSGFGVRRRIQVDKNRTIPDRFDSDEFLEDGVQGGRPISRMEMEERIQRLAKCLNGADIDMPEWMFSKMMRAAQIRFCDHSILRVIQILGRLGNWKRVLQVIEWLQMRERFKSHKLRFVYTAALDALGKAKRPVEALNVFRTMQQQKCTYPDAVAYHCIAVTLGQAGHMKELFDVMDSMRSVPKNFKMAALQKMDPRLEPDIVVYNAVLNACSRRKQWEGAFWVLQQLKQGDLKPTSTTYGLVMEERISAPQTDTQIWGYREPGQAGDGRIRQKRKEKPETIQTNTKNIKQEKRRIQPRSNQKLAPAKKMKQEPRRNT